MATNRNRFDVISEKVAAGVTGTVSALNAVLTAAGNATDTALVTISQTVATTSTSREFMQAYSEGVKTFWLNEWGAPRVRIPSTKTGDSVFKGMWSTAYTGVPFQLIKEGVTAAYAFAVHSDGSFAISETTAPASPPAATRKIYVKSDGNLYIKDPAGIETVVASATSITATGRGFLGVTVLEATDAAPTAPGLYLKKDS